MKTAIIIGATGLTGQETYRILQDDKRYSKIILLVRRKSEIDCPKTVQIVFDFDNLKPEDFFADEMYCCLGTTIKKAGSKAEFKKVDFDYVINTAKLAHKNGIKKYTVVSAMGANIKSKVFYNRVKGEMEKTILEIGFEKCCIVRPSLITGKRKEFRLGELIAKILMISLKFLIPRKYRAVSASKIAATMIQALNTDTKGFAIIESDKIYVN
jgi:uncharacterized protein YbjT (DUF2867 family)